MLEQIHLLDLDGTLIDSNRFVWEQKSKCISEHFNISAVVVQERLRKDGLAVVLEDLGLTIDEFYRELYVPWDPIEMARIGRLSFFDDTLPYLENSHALKYIVTNSSNSMTQKKDRALGLSGLVDGIYSAVDSREAKPDTILGERILLMLAKQGILDAKPKMLVVGDYETDIIFGQNMKDIYPNTTILIDRESAYSGLAVPDRIIGSLTEIL